MNQPVKLERHSTALTRVRDHEGVFLGWVNYYSSGERSFNYVAQFFIGEDEQDPRQFVMVGHYQTLSQAVNALTAWQYEINSGHRIFLPPTGANEEQR